MAKAKKKKSYDQKRLGYAGRFGSGSNIEILYLQTAFSPAHIENVSLIEEIPGSERWDIRDLFQRHVNRKRVDEIKNYLIDSGSVKFFNPITLILLPYDQHTHRIQADVMHLSPTLEEMEGYKFESYENSKYFQLQFFDDREMSEIHWNQENCRLVAIDGQHRLSAIKQIQANPKLMAQMGREWSMPAVVLVMSKADPEKPAPSLLEVVRKTFININQEAAQINRARLIILDDQSVNRICVQEIVNASHQNDQQDGKESVKLDRTPLMFFDWRGEVEGNREKPVEGSILSLIELEQLFENYVLGEDGSAEQASALGIVDMIPSVESFGHSKKLNHADSNRIREQFRLDMMPATQHILEQFQPFKEYIAAIRDIQFPEEYSELSEKAFKQICFGSPPVTSPDEFEAIGEKVREMVLDFTIAKQDNFESLLQRDIGLRAVFAAFGILKFVFDDHMNETKSWLEYANWYVPRLNALVPLGWFKGVHDDRSDEVVLFTEYTVFKPSGEIDNYKFSDVEDAFGAVLALQIAKAEDEPFKLDVWDKVENRLRRVLLKGLKSKIRSDLQSEPMTNAERTARVNELAGDECDSCIERMRSNIF